MLFDRYRAPEIGHEPNGALHVYTNSVDVFSFGRTVENMRMHSQVAGLYRRDAIIEDIITRCTQAESHRRPTVAALLLPKVGERWLQTQTSETRRQTIPWIHGPAANLRMRN